MQLPKLTWIALTGLAGCGVHADPEVPSGIASEPTGAADPAPAPKAMADNGAASAPVETASPVDAIDDNLARLRALDIFEVGDLVVKMPDATGFCYGAPPCAASEEAAAAAKVSAAERLVAFTNGATEAATSPSDSYTCDADIDANLGALRALAVVEIGEFIRSAPANNPICYNTPCPEDVAAADAVNHTRAEKLEQIALSVSKL